MRVLINQPVNFEVDPYENPYINEVKYQQLVQQGDITQFQFGTSEDVGAGNVLQNSTFSIGSLQGWYTAGQKAVLGFSTYDGTLYYKQTGDDRLASIIQQDSLIIGENYEVRINIIHSFNGYWELYLGTNRIAQLTSGVHVVAGIVEDTNQFKIKFIPYIFPSNDDDANKISRDEYFKRYTSIGTCDWVICQRKTTTNHRFVVSDLDDNTITKSFSAINDYLTSPYTPSSDAQFESQSLTISLDWQAKSVANGCHRIGVADADINTNMQCGCKNSELYGGISDVNGVESIPQWTLSYATSGYITFNTNDVTMVTGSTGGSVTMTQAGLKLGVTYDYSFEIISITGTGTTGKVYAGTDVDSYTTLGVKTGQLTCAGNTNLKIEMACTTGGFVRVNFLRIEAVASDVEPDFYSNPFNLQATHHRTFVVNCNNTDNVFGLNYEKPIWSPRARLRGYVAPDDNAYETNRLVAETSYGKREAFYYKRRKQQLLIIENEPEFMHDWLSLMGGHDHVMINNYEYFYNEDDYPSIKWDKWRVIGSTQIPISVKQSLDRKTIKGDIKIAQFIDDGDGNGVTGGFLDANPDGLSAFGEISGVPEQAFIFDPSDPTGTTAIQGAEGTTEDELTQYQQDLTNFAMPNNDNLAGGGA